MQHLGQFSSGCCFRSGLCASHHAAAGASPSVLWASLFCATGESVSLLIFTRGMREGGIYGNYPEMGWKMQIFNYFFPLYYCLFMLS